MFFVFYKNSTMTALPAHTSVDLWLVASTVPSHSSRRHTHHFIAKEHAWFSSLDPVHRCGKPSLWQEVRFRFDSLPPLAAFAVVSFVCVRPKISSLLSGLPRPSPSSSFIVPPSIIIMPDHPQLDAPLTLTGLFGGDDSESVDGDCEDLDANAQNALTYEVQELDVAGMCLKVRQFDFHSHNANRVWPGALRLAEYLLSSSVGDGGGGVGGDKDGGRATFAKHWGTVLELGTATGLLAVRLALNSSVHGPAPLTRGVHPVGDPNYDARGAGLRPSPPFLYCCDTIVTSDVQANEDDDEDLVAQNLLCNYDLNGIPPDRRPLHIPHTWGTGWAKSVVAATGSATTTVTPEVPTRFDTVVASDILLYVSAYPALVQTIDELLIDDRCQMVMSWNRRMKESRGFFELLTTVGLDHVHEGNCIYMIRRKRNKPNPSDTDAQPN